MKTIPCIVLCVGSFGFLEFAGIPVALAETAPKVEGFELLGTAGYAVAASSIGEDEVNPFGAFIGVDFGYTWRFGLRLGVEATYGFRHQFTRTSLVPGGADEEAEVRTASAAGSVGYDLLLSQFRLRGAIDLGAMPIFIEGGGEVAILVAPGVAAYWQRGAFEVGLHAKFIVQTNIDSSGVAGQLKAGARF